MEGKVTVSATPLVHLCGLLGVTPSDLAAVERTNELVHMFPVAGVDAARLDVAQVRTFVAEYGEDASIDLRTGDLSELVIDANTTDAAVRSFVTTAATGGPYNAIVRVDKDRLVHRLSGPSPRRPVRMFLFAETLRRALVRGIAAFEREVWPDPARPMVIAVLDTDLHLAGPHLTVVGGAELHQVQVAASTAPSSMDFVPIIDARDRHVGWDTPWTNALTPWHFELHGTCADATLRGLLQAQLVKLSILFTCDRARKRFQPTGPAEILAEYRGRQHVAVIPIDERITIEITSAEATAILRAVGWCYERHGGDAQPDWVSDRLPFVQTRVAQALEPHPIDQRLTAFTRSMLYLIEGIEWHWKAFIEGKVSEFLDEVQEVETLVSETVSGFSTQAADLVKGLTDTILAALAVLIGSFIAAAFSNPFNATLFRIGLVAYSVYVLAFPGALGLVASNYRLRNTRAEFDIRLGRFNETLYPDKVIEIVADRVTNAQRSYNRWLFFVAATYVAVVLTTIIAAVIVPALISEGSPATPKPASSTASPAQ